MNFRSSISENNGIEALTAKDKKIYSVGISTGGAAEIRMALADPERHIIATTIDSNGAEFARNKIEKLGLSHQIEVRIEDVTETLPYPNGYFDYIYARLVLHYLPSNDLQFALNELCRVLRRGGRIFVVVRSVDCYEARDQSSTLDPSTGLTTYDSNGNLYSRYFHSEESIQSYLKSSGFSSKYVRSYEEQLCVDFHRMKPAKQIDTLIEVLASSE